MTIVRSRVARALLMSLCVGACSSPPGGSLGDEDACSGTDCPADFGIDAGGDAQPDAPDAQGGDGGQLDASDASDCDGAPNACGGCAALTDEPDTVCGPCEFGAWECDGANAVVCVGDPGPRDWWVDNDDDGFGDGEAIPINACAPPSVFFADNDLDCDDGNSAVRPTADEVCNTVDDDCDEAINEPPDDMAEVCADACCSETLVCELGRCLIPCEATRCGADLDLCCGASEICFANTCTEPGDVCEFTEDCEVDEICQSDIGVCLPRDVVPACTFEPPTGVFTPELACRWTPAGLSVTPGRNDIVGTPIVINLTDDNEDGQTDTNDVPDIAFLTYDLGGDGCCNVPATLRIVSGRCNDDATESTPATMVTLASLDAPVLTNDTGLAAGDLDGAGPAEIVAIGMYGRDTDDRPGGTVAFRRTAADGTSWEVYWTNEDYPIWNVHTRGGAAASIADLNHDGDPEVIIGNVVLNGQDGTLLWDGNDASEDPVGVGNNAFLGPVATVADVNNDGFLEVIAGNTLYSHEGEVIETFDFPGSPNSICDGNLPCDGFNGVGNFDDDDFGEIVIVRLGTVYVLEHTMELQWSQDIPVDNCGANEAGPPTVADFDGDGRLEVGTAGADFYVVVDRDCDPDEGEVPEECLSRGVLWAVPNTDCSSRATASSVFDFEGDGAAEVVYADEDTFRIFDGSTGAILFDDDTHGSHTRIEMPVIADVDNDGNAEVVIPENGSRGGTPGIEVWEDAADNWVRTRRIWNQHAYHITNIEEGGGVPQFEEPNWLDERFNNFRQNVQPSGLFDAPDLLIASVEVDSFDCLFEVTLTVRNDGALSVQDGTPVLVELLQDDEVVAETEVFTTVRLLPTNSETLVAQLSPPAGVTSFDFVLRVTVDAELRINECDEDNNSATAESTLSCEPKD